MAIIRSSTLLKAFQYSVKAKPRFLSSLFRHNGNTTVRSEKIEFDVERETRDIAIPVPDRDAGYRAYSKGSFIRYEVTPPVYLDSFSVKATDLMSTKVGKTPYDDPSAVADVYEYIFSQIDQLANMYYRTIEYQASKVLTTGIVNLTDNAGNTIFSVDYGPNAAQFTTAPTTWATSTTKLADLANLSNVIEAKSGVRPNKIIMGGTAYDYFQKDDAVLKLLDNRRVNVGEIAPGAAGLIDEGKWVATITIAGHRYDIYVYSGTYKDPQTGNSTPFIPLDKLVMFNDQARLETKFGAIHNIEEMLNKGGRGTGVPALDALRGRFAAQSGVNSADLHVNPFFTPDGRVLNVGVGMRPLLLPIAIDTFGCLDVVP